VSKVIGWIICKRLKNEEFEEDESKKEANVKKAKRSSNFFKYFIVQIEPKDGNYKKQWYNTKVQRVGNRRQLRKFKLLQRKRKFEIVTESKRSSIKLRHAQLEKEENKNNSTNRVNLLFSNT